MATVNQDNNNIPRENNDAIGGTSIETNDIITEDYFKALVAEYIKLNDEIKTFSAVLKAKREKQTSIGQIIMEYTTQHGIQGIALDGQYSGMKLVTETQEKEQAVGKKALMDIIQEKLRENPAQLKSIMDAIENEKEIVEVDKVKISKVGAEKKKGVKKGKKKYGGDDNTGDREAESILLDGLPVSN